MGGAGDVGATPFAALFDNGWRTSSFGPAIAFIFLLRPLSSSSTSPRLPSEANEV
uniref:Uncharacterized protein n=1 Tax=Arundo donax TaxID=35708 RepID=A0A0A8ZCU8_ARUDO